MGNSWKNRVRHIQKLEPVTAGVSSRPDRELESNLQWLKDLVEFALMGQGLKALDQTVDPDALEGQPVFWNAATQRFEQAMAGVESAAGGVLRETLATQFMGLILHKTNATLADIAILGVFDDFDLSNAVDGPVDPGRYYLSTAEPGKIVIQRPDISLPVCHVFDDNKVLVYQAPRSFLEDHVHYTFLLTTVPAGDHNPVSTGGRHTIANGDSDLPGWLPADHESFDGRAPARAVFGYNLAQHPELNQVWPPVPLEAVQFTWDKGENLVGATEIPQGQDGLIIADRYGIWWLSNCDGDVPWPNAGFGSNSSSLSLGSQGSASPECPRVEEMRLRCSFIRMGFATNKTVVTSLTSLTPTLLEILNCDLEAASTGDLQIRLALEFLLEDAGKTGYKAVKGFNEETLQLQLGPVVEGLIAGQNVSLSGSTTALSDPTDEDSAQMAQGIVTINADVDPTGKELPLQLIRVDDMRERFDGNVMYLAMLADQQSGMRAKIYVPPTGLPSDPYVTIRAALIGTAAGDLPAVTLSKRNVPRPTATPGALPSGDTVIAFDVAAIGTVAAGDYFEVISDPIAIVAGDTLFFTLSRAGDDGYAGEVGVLRIGAVLQSGS